MEDFKTIVKLRTHDILHDFFRHHDQQGKRIKFQSQKETNNVFEEVRIKRKRGKAAVDRTHHPGFNKSIQPLQNQPLRRYFQKSLIPPSTVIENPSKFKPTVRKRPESPLPPPKPSHILPIVDGNKLMRRPLVEECEPLLEKDEFFQYLSSFPDLKPYSFEDNPIKTLEFYLQKFPILLRVPSTQETATLIVNRRRVRSPDYLLQRHRVTMATKQREMDAKIRELELDSDEEFVTEIKSKVFDPQSWPWNEGVFNSRPESKLSRPTSKLSRASSRHSRPASKQSRPSSKASS